MTHTLREQVVIPRPLEEVFRFFAAAENLERITPAELRFRILTPGPLVMSPGLRIDYRLRLAGVPFLWRTRISRWDPPHSFTDEQLAGPYAEWVHTHDFQAVPGGTRMTDTVRYCLPLFPVGQVAYPLVRLQLARIFRFRRRRILELLGAGDGGGTEAARRSDGVRQIPGGQRDRSGVRPRGPVARPEGRP